MLLYPALSRIVNRDSHKFQQGFVVLFLGLRYKNIPSRGVINVLLESMYDFYKTFSVCHIFFYRLASESKTLPNPMGGAFSGGG